MKVLYVLVSSPNDIFLEQTILSIFSLRKHSPNIKVSILVDDVTASTFVGSRAMILNIIDENIVIELDNKYSNKYKSRILKTNMRNYVEGDFLFIDSDTIILDDLSTLERNDYEIAAVYEFNRPLNYLWDTSTLDECLARFDYKVELNDELFNSGVMWIKDTPKNHHFFAQWHSKWKYGAEQDVLFDQPSLFITNKENEHFIKQLSGIWNCQGAYCLNYIRKVKIFHYLFDADFDFPLMKKESFDCIKLNGEIDETLKAIVCDPFAYISCKNAIIMNNTLDLIHTRQFRILRSLYFRYNKFFMLNDKIIDKLYTYYLKFKKRNLAPPR